MKLQGCNLEKIVVSIGHEDDLNLFMLFSLILNSDSDHHQRNHQMKFNDRTEISKEITLSV